MVGPAASLDRAVLLLPKMCGDDNFFYFGIAVRSFAELSLSKDSVFIVLKHSVSVILKHLMCLGLHLCLVGMFFLI